MGNLLSFAGYETNSPREFVNISGTAEISSATARTGARSLGLFGGMVPALPPFRYAAARMASSFAWRHAGHSGTTGAAILFQIRNGSGTAFTVRRSGGAELQLFVNGTLQDAVSSSATGFDVPNVFHLIGIQAHLIDDSAGFVSVYLGSTKILGYTGAITGGDAEQMRFGGSTGSFQWSAVAYLDDPYVMDAEGEPDAPPAPYGFLCGLAVGVGQDAAWSPEPDTNANWQNAAADDGDTTHNWSEVSGQRDTHGIAPILLPSGFSIARRIPFAVARQAGADANTKIRVHTYDGVYASSDPFDLPGTYAFLWTEQQGQSESDFNAAQTGYESVMA